MMKRISRIISLLVAVLLALTVLPVGANAAAVPSFNFSSVVTSENRIVLSVDLKNAQDLAAVQFSIVCDSALTPVECAEVEDIDGINLHGSTGIIVSAAASGALGGADLHLGTVTFDIAAPKAQNETELRMIVKIAQAVDDTIIQIPDATFTVQLHDYGEWTPVTVSTCMTNGTSHRFCSVCGNEDTRVDPLDKNNHSFTDYVYNNDATCEADGTKTAVCDHGCGTTDTQTAADTKLGHKYGDWKSDDKNTHSRVCANDASHIETAAHAYGDPVTVEATCSAEGSVTYTCTVCGYSYANPIEKLPHTPEIIPAVEAKCETTGLTEGSKCAVCGETLTAQETIPALGHDYQAVVTKEATCTEEGVRTLTCSRCGDSYTETIPAIPHTPETIPAVPPTCTTDGATAGSRCSVCGTILTAPETVGALGHDYKLTEDVAATCSAEGKKTYVCSRCGDSYTDVIEKLAHTPETIPGKAATCAETGLTEGSKCSVCGEILSAQKTVPTIAHTPEIIPAKDATCSENGQTEGSKCSVCGQILSAPAEIEKLGHDYKLTRKVDATCSEKGISTYLCSRCHDSYDVEEAMLPHTPEAIPAVAADCTKTGLTEGSKCSVCGKTIKAQLTVPALGHTDEDKDGKCDRCGETLVSTLRGDADLDGKVLAKDARLVLRASARLETLTGQAFINCDLDGNNKLLASEARLILRYSARLEKKI